MPQQNKQDKTFYRSFVINREAINTDKRTVELSFSSEEPVERWFGWEILEHTKKAVDLSRLRDGGALLLEHDPGKQIGVIESVKIDEREKKGKAVVRFSKSAFAEEIYQDVVDGIRKNVSVGYRAEEMNLEKKEGEAEYFRVTSWTPFEISIVPIPADISVGVGRNDDRNDIDNIKNQDKKKCQNINIFLKV